MFAVIGILAVVLIVGALIAAVGYAIFSGALLLIGGIVGLLIFIFALRGCMMG